jgi:hypothetical protein
MTSPKEGTRKLRGLAPPRFRTSGPVAVLAGMYAVIWLTLGSKTPHPRLIGRPLQQQHQLVLPQSHTAGAYRVLRPATGAILEGKNKEVIRNRLTVVLMTGGCSGTFIAIHFACERVSYNERGLLRIVKAL